MAAVKSVRDKKTEVALAEWGNAIIGREDIKRTKGKAEYEAPKYWFCKDWFSE